MKTVTLTKKTPGLVSIQYLGRIITLRGGSSISLNVDNSIPTPPVHPRYGVMIHTEVEAPTSLSPSLPSLSPMVIEVAVKESVIEREETPLYQESEQTDVDMIEDQDEGKRSKSKRK